MLLFCGFVWAGELPEIKLRHHLTSMEEFKEYQYLVKTLLEESFKEIAPGIRIADGCAFEEGVASWYGGRFHGRRTSSGEPYDMFKLTAASRTLPLNTYVLVRNMENGRIVIVRINDRGPYVDGRIIDLSRLAAYRLGMVKKGIAMVQVVPLRCLSPASTHNLYDRIIYDIANTY